MTTTTQSAAHATRTSARVAVATPRVRPGMRVCGWCGRWRRPRASSWRRTRVYVALVIGIASARGVAARPARSVRAARFPLLLAVGTVFAVVRMLLTVATTHGVGDVLFTTPHFGCPQLLGGFTVGGTVEPDHAAVAGRGVRHRRRDGRVRRVQLGGLAFRAGAVARPVRSTRSGWWSWWDWRSCRPRSRPSTTYARPTAPAPAAGWCAGAGSCARSCRCSSSGWSGR